MTLTPSFCDQIRWFTAYEAAEDGSQAEEARATLRGNTHYNVFDIIERYP